MTKTNGNIVCSEMKGELCLVAESGLPKIWSVNQNTKPPRAPNIAADPITAIWSDSIGSGKDISVIGTLPTMKPAKMEMARVSSLFWDKIR